MQEEKNQSTDINLETQDEVQLEDKLVESVSKPSLKKRVLLEIFEFFKIFFIVLSIWWICNLYFFEVNMVLGRSMYPTLHEQDRIIVNKIGLHFRNLERGDIITLDGANIDNQYLDKFLIKRIVGIPGDHIQIKEGQVYLNGQLLKEDYLEGLAFTMEGYYNDVILGENEYYVLGDNRSHSADSRVFGIVNRKAIKGYLIFRFFPFERLGTVE